MKRNRTSEKGAVSLEIVLAVLPIFLALFFATYIGDFMSRRAGLERAMFDALHVCSRGLGADEAKDCVVERLTAATPMCATVEIVPEVESFTNTYDDENLADPVDKELSLLRADVTCSMQFDIPLVTAALNFDLALDAQTGAAMPFRLDTELMP